MAFNWVVCAKFTLLILLIAAIIFACFTLPVKKVSFFHFHRFSAFPCFCFITFMAIVFLLYMLDSTQVRTQRTKCCASIFMLLYIMMHALCLTIWFPQFYSSHTNLTYFICFRVIYTTLYWIALVLAIDNL